MKEQRKEGERKVDGKTLPNHARVSEGRKEGKVKEVDEGRKEVDDGRKERRKEGEVKEVDEGSE